MSTSPSVAEARFARIAQLPYTTTEGPGAGTLKAAWGSLRELHRFREMLGMLVRRDLKAKYKDSALGLFWSLARPLLQLAIYFVVVGQFLGAERGIQPFAIYIFSGLIAYGLFSEILTGATGSIVANSGLVKKVYLPRELFPLASVGSALFNFAVQLVVLLVATIIAGAFPWHAGLLYALPSIAILVVYGTAIGLITAAVNVYLRDMQYLVELAALLLFWASPIVYSWQMVQDLVGAPWLTIFTDNPLTLAVLGFQQAFWLNADSLAYPDDLLLRMGVALAVGLVLLVVGHRVFNRLQGDFAQAL